MPIDHTPRKLSKQEEMEQVKLLVHQRGQIKGRVTSIVKDLDAAEADPSRVSLALLKALTKKLELHYSEFVIKHDAIVLAVPIGKADEQDEKINEFDALHTTALVKLNKLMEFLTAPTTTHDVLPAGNNPQLPHVIVQQQPLKAPIPTFDGKYENWPKFKALFNDIIGKCGDSDATKIHYLDKALVGEAAGVLDANTITDNNYRQAWALLEERYENPRVIVDTHINGLLSMKPMSSESYKELRCLIDTCNRHVEGLKFMKQPIDGTSSLIIAKLVTLCLDGETRKQWEKSLNHGELPKLEDTMQFLKGHCQVLERCEAEFSIQSSKFSTLKLQPSRKPNFSKVNAATLENGKPSESCEFCEDNHMNFQCPDFRKLSIVERIAKVKETNTCFNCLRRGHRSANCQSKKTCIKCQRKHHTLLHEEYSSTPSPVQLDMPTHGEVTTATIDSPVQKPEVGLPTTCSCSSSHTHMAYLLTAVVNLMDKNGQAVRCRCLLDSGSQVNLISETMFKKLGVPAKPANISISGVGGSRVPIRDSAIVQLQSRYNDFCMDIECLVTRKVISVTPSTKVDTLTWKIPPNLQLADPTFHQPDRVDMLVGVEHFFNLLKSGHLTIADDLPDLRETHLGWVVSGRFKSDHPFVGVTFVGSLEEDIKRFWELEELPDSITQTSEEEDCERYFKETHTRDKDGRFVVKLPFRMNIEQLEDNRSVAFRQFLQLERRLEKNPDLKAEYVACIEEYLKMNHCKEINEIDDPPNKKRYYLPHHAVIRPSSSTTKLRVVFNASSKQSSETVSLNDTLQVGAVVQSDLFSILIGFRQHRYAITGDIAKMYRQIRVDPAETSVQRIFWRQNSTDKIKVLELQTVTFGTAAAPFLATRALLQLCNDEQAKFPLASNIVRKSCYVDDLLFGVDSIPEGIRIQQELRDMLATAGFPVHKWAASSEEILQGIPLDDRETLVRISEQMNSEVVKTLGMLWDPAGDDFLFINPEPVFEERSPATKREVFSAIAKIFDPLGLISPIIVVAKQLMQQLWAVKMDWDEILNNDLQLAWKQLREALRMVNQLRIPRYVLQPNAASLEIHGFADASGVAYGACIYLRSVHSNGTTSSRLLCSKSKISPMHDVTIPRKELCAALLLTRLIKKVIPALSDQFDNIVLWSDSQIVLAWLRRHPSVLQPFVRNRVVEIVQNTKDFIWRYVQSKSNPADIVSRGASPKTLKDNKLWWEGPDFLRAPQYESEDPADIEDACLPELKPIVMYTAVLKLDELPVFSRFSSFRKLQRVIVYVQRFIINCRMKRRMIQATSVPPPSVPELRKALETIVRAVQYAVLHEDILLLQNNETPKKTSALAPFLQDGVLRVGGRINQAKLAYNTKHPYIMPKHDVTELLIKAYHEENLHLGPNGLLAALRQRFWILRGRSTIRKVTRSCIKCFRTNPKNAAQLMGNLPESRVTPSPPFEISGVDYAGPILVRQGNRKPQIVKAYIAVFICMATKAVHLEAVSDMTSEAFVAALHRFVSRRGLVREMHADNGRNFKGAKAELHQLYRMFQDQASLCNIQSFCQAKEIVWRFIPADAPEFGGLWEAAVKSAKTHLKRIVGNVTLTFEELATVLAQIEAVLNSRPLYAYSDDPSEPEVLTPGHFLVGRPLTAIAEPSYAELKESLLSRWQLLQRLKQQFWRSWKRDYLVGLQPRGKNRCKMSNIKKGMIVLLEDKNLPPQSWKIGRITDVFPGPDLLVRAVDVRIGNATFRRPVNRLSILPIEDNNQLSNENSSSEQLFSPGENVRVSP